MESLKLSGFTSKKLQLLDGAKKCITYHMSFPFYVTDFTNFNQNPLQTPDSEAATHSSSCPAGHDPLSDWWRVKLSCTQLNGSL